MNEFLPSRFSETVRRLALGLEPIDAGLGTRVPHPIGVAFDAAVLGLPRPPIDRHRTCLHVLLFDPAVSTQVDLRFVDPTRRFVPRRMTITLRTRAQADGKPYTDRVRRPALFPGAAYDAGTAVTGLRGRVLRGGAPMRWARAIATLPGTNTVIARAHGDDRGEFLLLIASGAAPVSETDRSLKFDVKVFGPAAVPVPPRPDLPRIDPLWDLPLEKPLSLGALDPVDPNDPMFAGLTLPANYTASAAAAVTFPFGRMISQEFTIV